MQLFLVTFVLNHNFVHTPGSQRPGKCPTSGNSQCSDTTSPYHTAAYRLPDGATIQGVKEWLENEGHKVHRVEIATLY